MTKSEMKRTNILLLIVVLMVGILFYITRADYTGEMKQLEFLIQQNQNLAKYDLRYTQTLNKMIEELAEKIKEIPDELMKDDLLEWIASLEEADVQMDAKITMLELQVEMLQYTLLQHLNPAEVPDQSPWREISRGIF